MILIKRDGRFGSEQAATITAWKWGGRRTGRVTGDSSKTSPTHSAMAAACFWKSRNLLLLLLPVRFFSRHSALPGQASLEALPKFIEADQQQTGFSYRIVPQTLSSGLASRIGLRYRMLKLVSALLIRLHSCHTVWIKLWELKRHS